MGKKRYTLYITRPLARRFDHVSRVRHGGKSALVEEALTATLHPRQEASFEANILARLDDLTHASKTMERDVAIVTETLALVVRHNDREVRLDLQGDEPSEVAFAAFYADCVHEVLPVTSGCRATLVFNLVRGGKGAALEPPNYAAETEKVATLLAAWAKTKAEMGASPDQDGDEATAVLPEKIADAAIARLLATAAPQASCDLHLALLTVWESGSAEYTGRERAWCSRCRRPTYWAMVPFQEIGMAKKSVSSEASSNPSPR